MGHRGKTTTVFAFAVVFLLLALAMIATSFGTNQWQEIYVDRDGLINMGVQPEEMTAPMFYSRHTGMFRTCYDEQAAFVDNHPNRVDGNCVRETKYEIPTRDPNTLSYGAYYEMRIHLYRTQFASFVLALLFLFVACITGVLGCWNTSPSMLRSTGVLVFIGMFFSAGGMALFHGVLYLDDRVLTKVPGTRAYLQDIALSDVTVARLADKTYVRYGFSYILGWIGLGFAALSGIFFLVVGYRYAVKHRETYGSKKARNRAYDYMDKNPPYVEYYGAPVGGPPPQDVLYIDNNAYVDNFGSYRY